MQSAAQTVHIPEKGETLSGVRILVFVMELPAGGLYVTMKTSFNIFSCLGTPWSEKIRFGDSRHTFSQSPSHLFSERDDVIFSDFSPVYTRQYIFQFRSDLH